MDEFTQTRIEWLQSEVASLKPKGGIMLEWWHGLEVNRDDLHAPEKAWSKFVDLVINLDRRIEGEFTISDIHVVLNTHDMFHEFFEKSERSTMLVDDNEAFIAAMTAMTSHAESQRYFDIIEEMINVQVEDYLHNMNQEDREKFDSGFDDTLVLIPTTKSLSGAFGLQVQSRVWENPDCFPFIHIKRRQIANLPESTL